jgi:hypothetical protein
MGYFEDPEGSLVVSHNDVYKADMLSTHFNKPLNCCDSPETSLYGNIR